MDYKDLYFMISIALQILIFFELRRQSKNLIMLVMSFLVTVLCVLFFYNVFLVEKQKTLFSFGLLVVVFLMFLWNVNYRFTKIIKWENISHFFYVKNYVIMFLYKKEAEYEKGNRDPCCCFNTKRLWIIIRYSWCKKEFFHERRKE